LTWGITCSGARGLGGVSICRGGGRGGCAICGGVWGRVEETVTFGECGSVDDYGGGDYHAAVFGGFDRNALRGEGGPEDGD